jgi:hypothetical protein
MQCDPQFWFAAISAAASAIFIWNEIQRRRHHPPNSDT